MFKVIIWGSDGSEHADRALDYARKLAEATSARLVAVHVNEITLGRAGGYPIQIDEEVERKIQRQVKTRRTQASTPTTSSLARQPEEPLTRWPMQRPRAAQT
jgi:nucleotide-binding universal stress UspA family protein